MRLLLDADLLHCRTPRSGKRCIPRTGSWDASHHCLSLAFASRGAAGGIAIKMQRQSIIREDVCFVDGSRRGELPGSGVAYSTPYRAGPSAEDPAGTFLPTSPAAESGTGNGLGDRLCSEDEGDRVVVRRSDISVHLARTRP
jgi:hypothetical protein